VNFLKMRIFLKTDTILMNYRPTGQLELSTGLKVNPQQKDII